MKNVQLTSVEEMRKFLEGNQCINFEVSPREDNYMFIRKTLVSTSYKQLLKKDKGTVKKYLQKVTGYEDKQLKRLIKKWKKSGLRYTKRKSVGAATHIYAPQDIALLIKTDIAHKTPNGLSTKAILMREFLTFGKEPYKVIANISVSHIYNLRNNSRQYLSSGAIKYSKTNPVNTNIGERKKPEPCGKPGFIRVDSVHQGDLDGAKGVYHINLVDEVTQWELVGCVPQITDEYMEPLLIRLLEMFPFVILNFHSDNGSDEPTGSRLCRK